MKFDEEIEYELANTPEFVEKRDPIERCFQGHEAKEVIRTIDVKGRPEVHVIEWRNPKSDEGWMRYIMTDRFLSVIGDYDDAIYEWGSTITFDFLARTGLSYFHSKCRASPQGRPWNDWDPKKAFDSAVRILRESVRERVWDGENSECRRPYATSHWPILVLDSEDWAKARTWRHKLDLLWGVKELLEAFVADPVQMEMMQEGEELGPDAAEAFLDDLPDGYVIDFHCILHWVGLRLAWQQLEGK